MVNLSSDEKLYLEQLCDGPLHAPEVANKINQNSSNSDWHPSDTVADRLDALADDSEAPDAGHLVEYNSQDGYELTSQGYKQLCSN